MMGRTTDLIKFLFARDREMAKMNHLETQEIIDGIYVIKTKSANFYLVNTGDGYLAIDAGGGSKNLIKNELSKLGINPEQIVAVLLTHSDFDHLAALGLFKNATIYLAKEEVQVIDGSTVRMFGFSNKLNYDYKTLEDNEEVYFGKVKVNTVLTPGHTSGSMSYLIDDKYLFVGDILSLQNGEVGLFNSLFNMDNEMLKKSLENLAQMQNIEYIFTAHYGFADDYQEAFKNFR